MNGQVQTHREGNIAPARRGIWAVPKILHDPTDYWLVSHILKEHAPVGLDQDEFSEWLSNHRKHSPLLRWTTFDRSFDSKVWTHLPAKGYPWDRDWYQCSVRELWKRIQCHFGKEISDPYISTSEIHEVFIEM